MFVIISTLYIKKTYFRRAKELESKLIEEETARRMEHVVAQRVEEELEKRREEIEAEVLRRVEEAKRVMEEQMMAEMERRRKMAEESAREEMRKKEVEIEITVGLPWRGQNIQLYMQENYKMNPPRARSFYQKFIDAYEKYFHSFFI